MTHVTAHEAFDNTPLLLLFPPDIQDNDLRDLIEYRADTIDQLHTALDGSQNAFTASFTSW